MSEDIWHAQVLTLYPSLFPGPLAESVVGNGLAKDRWKLSTINIREFGIGRHSSVDDTPAGGGPGMVMRCDVIASAVDHARSLEPDLPLIYLSPRGEPLSQRLVRELSSGPGVALLAGRFEGVDERVLASRDIREVSIGDYVLSGGELAAMVLIDACARLRPGVLGAEGSLRQESFDNGLLEHPHYTRPRSWEGQDIPDVLLSGDHKRIEAWRQEQSILQTQQKRPDLLARSKESGEI
ncbi:MAG: tRNA (guanosine(37)-N1)-methyltransferase TrmD [Pseudomonadota bacterium]